MMEGKAPDPSLFGFDLVYSIVFLIIGVWLLNKLGAKAAEKL
jgi:ABC-2 type transport system permease protein